MIKSVSASDLKNNLGSLLSSVRENDESLLIENRGAAAAVIISVSEFEKLQQLKEQARVEAARAELRLLRQRLDERQQGLSDDDRLAIAREIEEGLSEGLSGRTLRPSDG